MFHAENQRKCSTGSGADFNCSWNYGPCHSTSPGKGPKDGKQFACANEPVVRETADAAHGANQNQKAYLFALVGTQKVPRLFFPSCF
jgi:hypothetical protein